MKKVNIDTKLEALAIIKKEKMEELKSLCEDKLTAKSHFELVAPAYGLSRSSFGKEFRLKGTPYRVIGINENCRDSPIIVQSRSKSVLRLNDYCFATGDLSVVGVEAARYRNSVDKELTAIQSKYEKIIQGRDLLPSVLPTIGSDEYFNAGWSVEENEQVIRGFARRRASIIKQWTSAANAIKKMAIRRIVAFLIAVYQLEPWQALYAVEKTFTASDFSGSVRNAEKYIPKIDDEFSDPQLDGIKKWRADILSGKRKILVDAH